MANVCLYGGQAKRNGTQGCNCFAAPDCSSTEKCPLGLGGTATGNGTQECNCIQAFDFSGTVLFKESLSDWFVNDGNYGTRSTYSYSMTAGSNGFTCSIGYSYSTNCKYSCPSPSSHASSSIEPSAVEGGIDSYTLLIDIGSKTGVKTCTLTYGRQSIFISKKSWYYKCTDNYSSGNYFGLADGKKISGRVTIQINN